MSVGSLNDHIVEKGTGMRRITLCVAIAGIAALSLSTLPAFSADNGSVEAKITVASACITVEPAAGIQFPSLPFSTSSSPQVGVATPDTTVTNCSGASEQVFVRGTNATSATSSASWALSGTFSPAQNQFNLDLASNAAGGTFVAVDPVSRTWRTMPAAAADVIRTSIGMPTAGSDGSGETMSMSVTYTATL
jgi:hypothetical protein